MVDYAEHAAQSRLIFRSVLSLLKALTAAEAPAGNRRLDLLHPQSRSRSRVAAALYRLRCCCFQSGQAHFVGFAMEEEIVL